MNLRRISGDDIFISYSRKDGGLYAAALAEKLTDDSHGRKPLSCFLDKLEAKPDNELPEWLKTKIRSCTMFVLVASPAASRSDFVGQEIEVFKETGRNIVPVNVDGAFDTAVWYKLIPGLSGEPETSDALATGTPSANVIKRVETSFTYTRRNKRLARMAGGAFAVFTVLAALSALLFFYSLSKAAEATRQAAEAAKQTAEARRQTERAEANRREADAQTQKAADATQLAGQKQAEAETARVEAEKAQKAADEAKAEADAAQERASREEARALAASAEADRQRAEAQSVQFANGSVRSLEDDPVRALALAIRAGRTAPTAEAEAALKNALAESRMTALHWAQGDWSEGGWLFSSFTRDGGRLISAGETGAVSVIDAASGANVFSFTPAGKQFFMADLDPSGRRVVTASNDNVQRVWDAATGRKLKVLRAVEDTSEADRKAEMAFEKAMVPVMLDQIITQMRADGATEKEIEEFKAEAKKALEELEKEEAEAKAKEPEERTSADNAESKQVLFAAFVGEGDRVVTATLGGTVKSWDAQTGRQLRIEGKLMAARPVEPKGGEVPPLLPFAAFSNDRRKVAVINAGEKGFVLQVRSTEDGRKLNEFGLGELSVPQYAAMSGDGHSAVTMHLTKNLPVVTVWDLKTGKARKVIDERVGLEGKRVYPVLSNRGDKMVTCNEAGTVQSWFIEEGSDEPANLWVGHGRKQKRPLGNSIHTHAEEDSGVLWYAAFSPDDEFVVSLAGDNTARVTNFELGKEVFAFRSPTYLGDDVLPGQDRVPPIIHASFSRDGGRLLTSSADGGARLYDLTPRETKGDVRALVGLAERTLPSTLTAAELKLMLEWKSWGPPSLVTPQPGAKNERGPTPAAAAALAAMADAAEFCRTAQWTDATALALKSLLDEELGVDASVFRCEGILDEEYGADAADFARLSQRLEKEFSVVPSDYEPEELMTPGNILKLLRERAKAAPAARQ